MFVGEGVGDLLPAHQTKSIYSLRQPPTQLVNKRLENRELLMHLLAIHGKSSYIDPWQQNEQTILIKNPKSEF